MNSSLASLPTEILDLILSRPSHSYLAIDLWKTGDSILIAKLASGLTCLCLTGKPTKAKTHQALPQILTSFHALRILKLKSRQKLVNSPLDWQKIIVSLPQTLKELNICSLDADYAVWNFDPTNPREFITTTYKRGPSIFIDLAARFPQLETLILFGNRNFNVAFGFLDAEARRKDLQSLAGVPDTVTHLGVPDILLGEAVDGLKLHSLMPPSLTFLDAHVILDYQNLSLEEIQQDWNLPHLEKIRMLEWLKSEPEGGLSWLPQSLKHVWLENMAPWRRKPDGLSLSVTQTLPPALDNLYISHFDKASFSACSGPWLSVLPNNLTSLELYSKLPSRVAYLPRKLTSLQVTVLDLVAEQTAKQTEEATQKATHENIAWPPSLTSLNAAIKHIDKGVLCLLPHTLTNLKLHFTEAETIELDGRQLPPALKTLNLHFDPRVHFSTPNLTLIGPLPATLTHFGAHTNRTMGISATSLMMLPPSLTYLDTCMNLPKHRYVLNPSPLPVTLPPNLTDFRTNEFHVDWFSTLPRTLRHLSIYSVHGTLDVPESEAPTLFSGLPPSLESLELNAVLKDESLPKSTLAGGKVPSTSLRSLPSSLTSISLPMSDHEAANNPFPTSVIEGWSEAMALRAAIKKQMEEDTGRTEFADEREYMDAFMAATSKVWPKKDDSDSDDYYYI